ncbi:MAG TPA: DUF885 domain-containing protein [Terriglobales bacterium]|nr:DUF885 domain-containing protein [Terriglobales bacterium]
MKLLVLTMMLCMMAAAQTNPKHKSRKAQPKAGGSQGVSCRSDDFMRESLALSPVNASQAGYHKHTDPLTKQTVELDAQLDDFSPTAIERQRKFYSAWQGCKRTRVSVQDSADWQLINDQIALNLLDLNQIRSYQHNPTVYVELIGNALFLPLTQNYAVKEVRLGHVLARMEQIPRLVQQAKAMLADADPIYVKVAVEENDGNIDLIQSDIKEQIGDNAELGAKYQKLAPAAISALKDFSQWLQQDLASRPNPHSWRLGKEFYDAKFKYVMETDITPAQVLASAENEMKNVRAQMLEIALPLHAQMYPGSGDYADLPARERENKIISEVLAKIADDHVQPGQLIDHVKQDLDGIIQFIREKKIVGLSDRENLKVIPTPVFLRGVYSVAGFHQAPPLEPEAEAEYWVTPIDPKTPQDKVESKLREYNNWVLKWLSIHEALPGHYIQFEHANSVEPKERRLLRSVLGNGAYIEGWAEYVAQVMMEEGFLNRDPRFVLSMKKIRLRVLANAILDIRMHTMNMTDDEALDLMMNSAFQTRSEAEGKLQRAKLTSTQLPTYYVGINEWWELRHKYEAAKGKDFNLMEFHNAALDQGPLPVPLLGKILLKSAN